MDLAVVTGQRVGDLCRMKWSDINDGHLHIGQSKTGAKIAIPLALTIEHSTSHWLIHYRNAGRPAAVKQ